MHNLKAGPLRYLPIMIGDSSIDLFASVMHSFEYPDGEPTIDYPAVSKQSRSAAFGRS
jgi:hypothetical protein